MRQATGHDSCRWRQISTDHQGLRITLAERPQASPVATARIQNSRRTEAHEIEPLEHAPFDLTMQKIGIDRPQRAPVKLTPHGIQAQTSNGSHLLSISTTRPAMTAYAQTHADPVPDSPDPFTR